MLRRPEATTKDPSADTNVVLSFFLLLSAPSLSLFLPSFSLLSLLLLLLRLLLLLWWNRRGSPRFHVVNGRSEEIDGSIEKLRGRSDCIINWDTRYRCSLGSVCFYIGRSSADTRLPERRFNWFVSRIIFLQFRPIVRSLIRPGYSIFDTVTCLSLSLLPLSGKNLLSEQRRAPTSQRVAKALHKTTKCLYEYLFEPLLDLIYPTTLYSSYKSKNSPPDILYGAYIVDLRALRSFDQLRNKWTIFHLRCCKRTASQHTSWKLKGMATSTDGVPWLIQTALSLSLSLSLFFSLPLWKN